MSKGLYIHIPFCQEICSYCDFTKVKYNSNQVNNYLIRLKEELDQYDIKDISSIYVGGGTPTSLSEEELETLLKIIEPYFYNGISYTFEANFENLSKEKIDLLKKYHVNRISLGVQSFLPRIKKLINRNHNKELVIDTISYLHKVGIDDINVDLIYGFYNQTLEELELDLKEFLSLNITHISTYALSINKHTELYNKGYLELDDDLVRKMYDLINIRLSENGFNRYEVSNFSKPNYQSRHNLIYWRNEEYFGIGCGASGYINNIRYTNTKSLTKYLNGNFNKDEEIISELDKDFYQVMLGLRLVEGTVIPNRYLEKADKLVKENLLEKINGKYKVKDENFFILDFILNKILF